MKYLLWHTPRTGSTLLANMLHQTGVAGFKDFVRCSFPLGAQKKIEPKDFPRKLREYENAMTTDNGVFGSKLSWDGLSKLCQWVGVEPVYNWLDSIDVHFYLHRLDLIAQSVSLYIANKRRYFTTLREPQYATPPYSYDEIAHRRMLIERDKRAIGTHFIHIGTSPARLCFEEMTHSEVALRAITAQVLERLGENPDHVIGLSPEIQKQENPAKAEFTERFRLDYGTRRKRSYR